MNRRLLPLSTAGLLALAAPWAGAETSPYSVGAVETVMHDSNIFRTPQPVADWVSVTGLLASVDQRIGRDRVRLNAEVDSNRYRANSALNQASHQLGLTTDWQTVEHLSGQIGFSDRAQAYLYAPDSASTAQAKNTLSTRQGQASVNWGGVSELTLSASLGVLDRTYSAAAYQSSDQKRRTADLGLRHAWGQEINAGVSVRRTRGSYPHLSGTGPDDFSRSDVTVGVVWTPASGSTFDGSVGRGAETHSVSTTRSYHVWTSDVNWRWLVSGKSALTFSLKRDTDTGSVDFGFAGANIASNDTRVRTRLNLGLSHQLSGKVRLNAGLGLSRRELQTDLVSVGDIHLVGGDLVRSINLGMDWQASRTLSFGCAASREVRTAHGQALTVTYGYDGTVLSCTGQWVLGD